MCGRARVALGCAGAATGSLVTSIISARDALTTLRLSISDEITGVSIFIIKFKLKCISQVVYLGKYFVVIISKFLFQILTNSYPKS